MTDKLLSSTSLSYAGENGNMERFDKFLPLPEVCQRICLRKSWIYDAMQRGEFPRPIYLTPRRVAWRESDIEAWMAERIAASVAAREGR